MTETPISLAELRGQVSGKTFYEPHFVVSVSEVTLLALVEAVSAALELEAAIIDRQRVGSMDVLAVAAERGIAVPAGDDIADFAQFGEDVFGPYRDRANAAEAWLRAALSRFVSGGS